MISGFIENILKSVTTDSITDIFVVAILILFVLSILWTRKDTHHTFTGYAPNLLTSVGILGTFTGIVIGLLEFDTQHIDESITLLLDGLKVAFITSLVGIFASITLKFIASTNLLLSKQSEEDIAGDVGIEDLYSIMVKQNENIIKLQKSLSDNDDSSLIGQFKLLRSDTSDNNKVVNNYLEAFKVPIASLTNIDTSLTDIKALQTEQKEFFTKFTDTLWIKLQDFSDMLSKSATEQVINALKEVIKDFNEKLTEQFGENFKQLNSSVEKLVIWQDEYKGQLQDMKTQFDSSVTAMSTMEKSIESISTNSKSIPQSMDTLKEVMTVNQHQIQELDRHLEAFKDIRDKAVEAVPEIRTQIDNTIKGIQEASLELINGVSTSTEKISVSFTQSAEEFENKVGVTNAALVSSSDTLTASSTEIREQLDAMLQDVNKHIRSMVEDLSTNSKEVSNDFKEVGTTLIEEMKSSNVQIQENLSSMTTDLQGNIENLTLEQTRQMQKVFDGLDQTITQTMQRTGDSVSNQVKLMDELAGKEIENIMQAMGQALARISNQFTNDYQKLVSEMQKIIETK